MLVEEDKEAVRRLGQVINSGNLDQLDEILASDYIQHDLNPRYLQKENVMIAEDWHIFHSIGLWQELIPEIGALIEQATK